MKERKIERKKETTGQKYNGLPYWAAIMKHECYVITLLTTSTLQP